jgi:Na+/H+ antiporter NhaD/arsenite permease-like protein
LDWKLIFSVTVLLLTYVFMLWERIPRVVTALLGASALVACHVITQKEAFNAIDFNVIALLFGMMILVNILSHTGLLNCIAIWAAKSTGGSPSKLILAFSTLSGFLSAFLDNVTTVLLLGTVTCVITRRLKLNPVPFLICEAICSNVGGTATLIGDPPNIMIGSAAGLDFYQFLVTLAPFILIIFPVILGTLFLIYRKTLQGAVDAKQELDNLSARDEITDRPLMIKALVVISLVIVGFILHGTLNLEAGTIAVAGASALLIFEHRKNIWSDVEWTTIFFFIGLYIIVGAVEATGALKLVAQDLLNLVGKHSPFAVSIMVLWLSALCSAVIDNIPYTATMIPIVETIQAGEHNPTLWWALSLGACLGGNGSLIGATANVVAADIAHANGEKISFAEFSFVGIIITIETLILSSIYLFLVQRGIL